MFSFLRSKFFVIFLLTFTNWLSFSMLIPVLPSIIRNYDLPEIYLGLLLWTYSLFQFVATPIIWKLSDYYGRKKLLVITQMWTLACWIILWIAYTLPEKEIFWVILLPILIVFLARAIDGITWGNESVARSVIADKTKAEERSSQFWNISAVMGFSIIVGPALWSFSLGWGIWFLWTAVVWALVSIITLVIMYLYLQESLQDSDKADSLKIEFKRLNIIGQFYNWKDIWVIKYASIMRVAIFIAFISYTSIGTLYLIDNLGFTDTNVWYFSAFVWTFIIFHQIVSVKNIVHYFWDRVGLIIGLVIMGLWFIWMWLAWENLYVYCVANFVSILWVWTCFSTNSALFSKSVDKKNQGEILGFSSSIQSLIAVWVPPLATYIYSSIDFSIYYIIGTIPLIAAVAWKIYFWKPRYK